MIDAPAIGEASLLAVTFPVMALLCAKVLESEKNSRHIVITITCSNELAFIINNIIIVRK